MQWILEGFTQKPKQNMVLIGVYQVMQAFVLLKLTNIKKHVNTGCIGFQMSQKLAASILAFQAFKGFIGTWHKKKISISLKAFLENSLFVLLMHKSWIWPTLGHVMDISSNCHFHNASRECFWPKKFSNFTHGFKSAILAIFQFCQSGTFKHPHQNLKSCRMHGKKPKLNAPYTINEKMNLSHNSFFRAP